MRWEIPISFLSVFFKYIVIYYLDESKEKILEFKLSHTKKRERMITMKNLKKTIETAAAASFGVSVGSGMVNYASIFASTDNEERQKKLDTISKYSGNVSLATLALGSILSIIGCFMPEKNKTESVVETERKDEE